uniref:Uncharacterized protein n=1 Tax=Esox lucius TaxID=8010 RepID=A0A3P8ZVV0_ESOLU
MSTGLSKKRTRTGSLSKDARICSKANDHSISCGTELATRVMGVLGVLKLLSGVLEASPSGKQPSRRAWVWLVVDFKGLAGSWSLRPTSSILRRRLVTRATAWYRDSSSGSPWNRLYSVLENWIN